jgi:hypothetical protein
MSQRFVVRMMGLPATMTREQLQAEILTLNICPKMVYVATLPDGVCAGFAFVEFACEESLNIIKSNYELSQNVDVMYKPVNM